MKIRGRVGNQTNRTPTGRQPVYSYYAGEKKAASNSSKSFLQQEWLRNLPSLIALIALTFSVLYCLGLSTDPRIVVADSNTSTLRSKQSYQQAAQQILERSVLNRTKFTINTTAVERAFQKEFPEVSDVSVALPLIGHRPVINLASAQPIMIFASNGQAVVLDARGLAIMRAGDLTADVRQNLPVVTDQSGLSAKVGNAVLPSQSITYIEVILAQLKAQHLSVSSVTLPAVPQQVNFQIAGQPYLVKFSFDTDAREAAGTFLAAKQYLEASHSIPSHYIDVRVPGRVYYQ